MFAPTCTTRAEGRAAAVWKLSVDATRHYAGLLAAAGRCGCGGLLTNWKETKRKLTAPRRLQSLKP